MSKLVVVSLVTVLGLVVVSGAVSAQSSKQVIKIKSTEKKGSVTYLDKKLPKGESVGDVLLGQRYYWNAVPQFGEPKGYGVGRENFRLVATGMKAGDIQTTAITMTARLPRGTIRCKGTENYSRSVDRLTVVGATGAFSKAKGTCERHRAHNGVALIVFRLQLPG